MRNLDAKACIVPVVTKSKISMVCRQVYLIQLDVISISKFLFVNGFVELPNLEFRDSIYYFIQLLGL